MDSQNILRVLLVCVTSPVALAEDAGTLPQIGASQLKQYAVSRLDFQNPTLGRSSVYEIVQIPSRALSVAFVARYPAEYLLWLDIVAEMSDEELPAPERNDFVIADGSTANLSILIEYGSSEFPEAVSPEVPSVPCWEIVPFHAIMCSPSKHFWLRGCDPAKTSTTATVLYTQAAYRLGERNVGPLRIAKVYLLEHVAAPVRYFWRLESSVTEFGVLHAVSESSERQR